MTKAEAIAELVRIWHSPHLDLILKARLGEVIDALEESNLNDSLVRGEVDARKESESKLDLISRADVVNEIHKYFVEEIDKTPTEIDEDGDELYTDMPTVNSLLACNKELSKRIKSLPSAEPKTGRAEMASSGVLTPTVWAVCSECKNPIDPWDNYCSSCGARILGEDGEA